MTSLIFLAFYIFSKLPLFPCNVVVYHELFCAFSNACFLPLPCLLHPFTLLNYNNSKTTNQKGIQLCQKKNPFPVVILIACCEWLSTILIEEGFVENIFRKGKGEKKKMHLADLREDCCVYVVRRIVWRFLECFLDECVVFVNHTESKWWEDNAKTNPM